jgi:hypothetical protein
MILLYFFYSPVQNSFDSSLFTLLLRVFANFETQLLALSYLSVRLSVRLSIINNLATTGRNFMKVYWVLFENLQIEFKFLKNLTIITGTLQTDVCTYFMIPCSPLRMRNASKLFWEIRHTYFIFSNIFQKVVLLWSNVGKYGRARLVTDDIKYRHALCFLDN